MLIPFFSGKFSIVGKNPILGRKTQFSVTENAHFPLIDPSTGPIIRVQPPSSVAILVAVLLCFLVVAHPDPSADILPLGAPAHFSGDL